MLDLVQHGNGKRIARSCSSVLSRSRLISFLLVLLVCVPPTILLLLLVVAHVRALLLLFLPNLLLGRVLPSCQILKPLPLSRRLPLHKNSPP